MAYNTDNIDTITLSKFSPLNTLSQSELEILAGQVTPMTAHRGEVLVECGASDEHTLFLIKGSLKITAADGYSFEYSDDSPRSREPISHLNPHLYTVTCLNHVTYMRIDNHLIDNLLTKQPQNGETVEDLFVSVELLDNPLFQDIYHDLLEDRLVIPTFPEIAVKMQKVVEQETDIRHIEKIIQFDPATAAMIVKAANSALYSIGKPVRSINQAVMRMGVPMTKQLVITYSLRELFNSRYPLVNRRMKYLWKHSAEVAATAHVLAKKLGDWDADHALLLGLLHDIGMLPILRYTEQYPDIAEDDAMLTHAIEKLHGDIGAIILKAWHFSEDFIITAHEADDWYRDNQAEPDYCDIVLLSQLHTFIGKGREKLNLLIGNRALPPLTQLPAFKKLCLEDCGPEESLAILSEANQQIHETAHLLML